MKTYYVMYWNDREDYPVAVFEVKADCEENAEQIAFLEGGRDYEDDWPLLIETNINESRLARYKNSVWTKYKVCKGELIWDEVETVITS